MNRPCAAIRHHFARTAGMLVLAAPALACAAGDPPEAVLSLPAAQEQIDEVGDDAVKAAVADGITTGMALSAGAVEMNPLVSTSPLGLIALTGAKIGLVKYAETLPEQEKRLVIKTSTAIWGGAAVSNLMVLMAAPTPLAVVAGVLMGVFSWQSASARYEAADRVIAAHKPLPPLEPDMALAYATHAR